MILNYAHIVLLQVALLLSSLFPPSVAAGCFSAHNPQARGTFGRRENNVYAPDLYASDISFTATLVDLPGAKNKNSYWELSYQLYFIPENDYYQALESMRPGTANPGPEQFPVKVLIAEGHEKKSGLATLKERTLVLNKLPFKNKVPDAKRTKYARLMTSYSVKIFDAELNTSVYRSGVFLAKPYEDDPANSTRSLPRQSIYLNFIVTPQGVLNRSQTARKAGDTTWQ